MSLSILSAAGGIGMNGLSSLVQGAVSEFYTDRAREKNYKYNEKSAENAYRRQQELLNNYYTPQAQMQQLKEAGLSPSLMYGGSGTTGTTNAPSGSGGGNISNNYTTGDPLVLAQLQNIAADTTKKQAEAKNIEEDTKTQKGENERGAAEIKKMLSELGLNKAKTIFTESETTAQNLMNAVNSEAKEDLIATIQYQGEKLYNEAAYYNELTSKVKLEYNFEKDTYTERVEQIKQTTLELATKILLNDAKTELTEAQQIQIQADITALFEKLKIEAQEVAIKGKEANTHAIQLKFDMDKFKHTYALEWQKLMTDFTKFDMELSQKNFNTLMNFAGSLLGNATKLATSK